MSSVGVSMSAFIAAIATWVSLCIDAITRALRMSPVENDDLASDVDCPLSDGPSVWVSESGHGSVSETQTMSSWEIAVALEILIVDMSTAPKNALA